MAESRHPYMIIDRSRKHLEILKLRCIYGGFAVSDFGGNYEWILFTWCLVTIPILLSFFFFMLYLICYFLYQLFAWLFLAMVILFNPLVWPACIIMLQLLLCYKMLRTWILRTTNSKFATHNIYYMHLLELLNSILISLPLNYAVHWLCLSLLHSLLIVSIFRIVAFILLCCVPTERPLALLWFVFVLFFSP